MPDMGDYRQGIDHIIQEIDQFMSAAMKRRMADRLNRYRVNKSVSHDLARYIAIIPMLEPAVDVIRLSQDLGIDLMATAQTYYALDSRMGLDWLMAKTAGQPSVPGDDRHHQPALESVREDIRRLFADLVGRVITGGPADEIGVLAVDRWAKHNQGFLQSVQILVNDCKRVDQVRLSVLTLLRQKLEKYLQSVDA